jgi:carboxypeptidase C (cathepsin A)
LFVFLLQVFWTNGGPGCSSVGGGLFSESGPFRPNAAGGLSPNPWTWSSAANMLYVEQPAGVGFSYSNNTADYTVGDARAADDVFWFLQGFMKAFPQFAAAPLWITGESYGGHYVPSIARCGATASGCSPVMSDGNPCRASLHTSSLVVRTYPPRSAWHAVRLAGLSSSTLRAAPTCPP